MRVVVTASLTAAGGNHERDLIDAVERVWAVLLLLLDEQISPETEQTVTDKGEKSKTGKRER